MKMHCLVILATLSCVCLLAASPLDPQRQLKRQSAPPRHLTRGLEPGEAGYQEWGVKGGRVRQEFLKKGEYYCGNKICKLKPGEVPEGCNGMCQYPIQPLDFATD